MTFIAAIMLAPCAYCWWVAAGQNLLFQIRLPVYPGAIQLSSAYAYAGAGNGHQTLYFWTVDNQMPVADFYETFAIPFVEVSETIDGEPRSSLRTVFNPTGNSLLVATHEFTGEVLDPSETHSCAFDVFHYQCVEIHLYELSEHGLATLPKPYGLPRPVQTATPLTQPLIEGTLIVYSYYVLDIS